MRLICPNCGAQYEIDDTAIPPGGRDVQCSDCRFSWFHTRRAPLVLRSDATESEDSSQPQSEGPHPQPPRRRPDAQVLAVLREEAEREQAARKDEAGPGDVRAMVSRDTAAPDRGRPHPIADVSLPTRGTGTAGLSASAKGVQPTAPGPSAVPPHVPDMPPAPPRELGWLGMVCAVAAFGVATLLYAQPDSVVQAVPSLEGPVTAYVEGIDAGRIWLDATADSILAGPREQEN